MDDKTEVEGSKSGVLLKQSVGDDVIWIAISSFLIDDFVFAGAYRSLLKMEIDGGAIESKIGEWRVFSRILKVDDHPEKHSHVAARKFGGTACLLRIYFNKEIAKAKGIKILEEILPTVKEARN